MDKTKQKTSQQLIRFLVVGSASFVLDTSIYWSLHTHMSILLAKWLSFVCAVGFNFSCNKWWTFQKPTFNHWEIFRYLTLYSCSSVLNTTVNHYFFHRIGFFPALVMASGASMVFNFLLLRLWVFRH